MPVDPNEMRDQVKDLTGQLEQGVHDLFTTDQYTTYLKTMDKFHEYSFNNQVLIAQQKPDATLVAGYEAWRRDFNRHVRKGEKGIRIIAPITTTQTVKQPRMDENGNEIHNPDGSVAMEEVKKTVPRFAVRSVFDVSQTDGEPLPERPGAQVLTGSVENYNSVMNAIENICPVPIHFGPIEGTANGYFDATDNVIMIKEGLSEAQTVKTMIHETTHAILHNRQTGMRLDPSTRETQAESVAYIVCNHFGIDTSDYTFPYIAAWASSMEMKELKDNISIIQDTASDFITKLETELEPERLQDVAARETDDPEIPGQMPLNAAEAMEQAAEQGTLTPEQQAAMRTAVPGLDQELNERVRQRELNHAVYEQVEMFGVPMLYSPGRVENANIPEGLVRYELRGSDVDPDGPPATVESEVTVNFDGTILSPVRIPQLENGGHLNVNGELNFADSHDTTVGAFREVLTQETSIINRTLNNHIIQSNESAVLATREPDIGDSFAIYQINGDAPYEFMGTDFMAEHNMEAHAVDYDVVYGGTLGEDDTPESLFERFNLARPDDFEGHSLSVSDVIVINRGGIPEAFYVDSFGFAPLSEFIREREEIVEAKEAINEYIRAEFTDLDGADFSDPEHVGLAYTEMDNGSDIQAEVDLVHFQINKYTESAEIPAETQQFDSLRDMIDNALRNLDFIELTQLTEQTEELEADIPVYRETAEYAQEHGEMDSFEESRRMNIECAHAIDEAINENYQDSRLNSAGAEQVVDRFGTDRVEYVLAVSAMLRPYDTRIIPENREWAQNIMVGEEVNTEGRDVRSVFAVNSHTALLDGFIRQARNEIDRVREEALNEDEVEISEEEEDLEDDELVVDSNTDGLVFIGHKGEWRVTDHIERAGNMYFLTESSSEEESLGIIIDREGYIVVRDVELSGDDPFTEDVLDQIDEWVEANDNKGEISEDDEELDDNTMSDLIAAEREQRKVKDRQLISAESKLDAVIEQFATDMDQLSHDYDPYEYADAVYDPEENIDRVISQTELGDTEALKEWLNDVIYDEGELAEQADELLGRLETIEDMQAEIEKMRNSIGAQEKENTELSDSVVIAEYVYEDKSGNPSQIVTMESENGFYNYFDFDESQGKGLFYTGPFDSLSEARQNIKQHEPTAQEKAIYGSDMPLYPFSYEHADKNGELAEYNESCKRNVECKAAIEGIVAEEYSGISGSDSKEAVKELVNRFGAERVEYILANSVDKRNEEPGIVSGNKEWACEVKDSKAVDLTEGIESCLFTDPSSDACVVNSQPEALNQLIVDARSEILDVRQKETIEKPEITFYVAENAQFSAFGRYYDNLTLEEAIEIYKELPDSMGKGFGFHLHDGSSLDGVPFPIAVSDAIVDYSRTESVRDYVTNPLVEAAAEKFDKEINGDKKEPDHDLDHDQVNKSRPKKSVDKGAR